MFRSVSHKSIFSATTDRLMVSDRKLQQDQEPENFAEYLMRTKSDFKTFTAASLNESVFNDVTVANFTKNKEFSPIMQSELGSTIQHSKMEHRSSLQTLPKSKERTDSMKQKQVGASKHIRGSIYQTASQKTPYKLVSQNEGAFAFNSKAELEQPYYQLQFREHDLAFQLEVEELENKKDKKKGEAMILAMRHKLKMSVNEMQEKEKLSGIKGRKTQAPAASNAHARLASTLTNADSKKGGAYEAPIRIFTLNKVKYRNDDTFPFELLCDVPRTVKKALEALNMSKVAGETATTDDSKDGGPSESSQTEPKQNELLRFLKYNESGFNNLVVYLFWIIVSEWFNDYDSIRFTPEFIRKVRDALYEQYRKIYFNYLLRLRQQVMDSIIDILPFLLAEIIRNLIQQKLRNHDLPLNLNKTFILLISSIFRELYGFETSEVSIALQKKSFIKSLADRIKTNKTNVKRKQQRRSQESSPEKVTGGQTSNNPKNSIYGATFKNQRDPNHNMRDFSREIKSDMVNEMITEWGKLTSLEAKMQISEQINQFRGSKSPEKILAHQEEGTHEDVMKRRKGFLTHWCHSQSDISCQNRKISHKRSGLKHNMTTVIRPQVMNMGTPTSPLKRLNENGSNRKLLSRESKDEKLLSMPQVDMNIRGSLARTAENSASPQHSRRGSDRRIRANTASSVKSPDLKKKVNHFTKKRIKVKEYEPESKNEALESLKKRIKSSQKELELQNESAYKSIESSVLLPNDKKRSAISNKMQGFDLQHVTPIIRRKFPAQLEMNFNPNRKQRNMSIQKELDMDRVETYKVLQYDLKKIIKERKGREESQLDELSKSRQKRLKNSQTTAALKQHSMFQMPDHHYKKMDSGQQRRLFSSAVQSVTSKSGSKGGGVTPLQKKSSSKSTSKKILMSSMKSTNSKPQMYFESGVGAGAGGDTMNTTGEQTRNVRFKNDEGSPDPYENSSMQPDCLINIQQYDDSANSTVSKKGVFTEQTPLADSSQAFFFEKANFMSAQINREESKLEMSSPNGDIRSKKGSDIGGRISRQSNSRARINLKLLTSADGDDFNGINLSTMSKSHTSAHLNNTSNKTNKIEKSVYDHVLMQKVKKSIKVRKHLLGSSLDDKGLPIPQQQTSGLPKIDSFHDNESNRINIFSKVEALSKSRSQAALGPNQSLPLLSTSSLHENTTAQKQESRQKESSGLIAALRPKQVKFDTDDPRRGGNSKNKKKEEEIIMITPFTEQDTNQQLMRKTTKILSKGKYKLSTDGNKHAPMHTQLRDYMTGLAGKADDSEKLLKQELIRKKLINMLPADLRKPEKEQAFKTPPPRDYLASKHTYSSMKKISNMKSRAQFIFDDYDQEMKKLEAVKVAMASSSKPKIMPSPSIVDASLAVDSKRSPSYSHGMAKSTDQDNAALFSQEGGGPSEPTEFKTYHIYKGSNFNKVKSPPATEMINSEKSRLPPRPSVRHAANAKLLHTMKTPHFPNTHSEDGYNNSSYSEINISDDGEVITEEERKQREAFHRKNLRLNENDDRADVRDGIAETKGVKLNANGTVRDRQKLQPREQNTKLYRMLKDMRSYIDREDERKMEVAIMNEEKQLQDLESDDEKERCGEDQDQFIARPNPLELQTRRTKPPMHQQKKPEVRPKNPRLELQRQFKKQVQMIHENINDKKLTDKRQKRKTNDFLAD